MYFPFSPKGEENLPSPLETCERNPFFLTHHPLSLEPLPRAFHGGGPPDRRPAVGHVLIREKLPVVAVEVSSSS